MKERLIGRVGRIISGSVNSLIDAIENAAPETVMEEAIREIDSAIDDVRAELGKVIASKHLATIRLEESNRKHADLTSKIEMAVKERRDDLAEAAISMQLDIEAQMPVLEASIADCGQQEKELEGYISALQGKKREMQQELRNYRKEANIVDAETTIVYDGAPKAGSGVEQKVAKAESAFERIVEKASGIPSSGVAMARDRATKLAELEEMARNNRIQERLAAIKGRTEGDD